MEDQVESSEVGLLDEAIVEKTDQARVEPTSQAKGNLEMEGFEKQLGEMIEKEVERRFQSAKDKRWVQLEKQYGDLSELREMAEVLLAESQESTDQPGLINGNLEARLRSLAELPGLRTNEDAKALILRNLTVADSARYAQVMEDLIRMALGGANTEGNSPANSAATAVIPGGGDAPGDLALAYQRRKQLLRPGDINALTALKREFRLKGLDVF